jgi:hypothetical protein
MRRPVLHGRTLENIPCGQKTPIQMRSIVHKGAGAQPSVFNGIIFDHYRVGGVEPHRSRPENVF